MIKKQVFCCIFSYKTENKNKLHKNQYFSEQIKNKTGETEFNLSVTVN